MGINTIWIIVLAAGEASRFGSPKQLAKLYDKSLLSGMALKLEKLQSSLRSKQVYAKTALVLGAHADLIKVSETLGAWDLVVDAQSWQQGMSASLSSGLSECLREDRLKGACSQGALVLLLDQPMIEPEQLAQMIGCGVDQEKIICASYADSVGVPVFFPAEHFSDLQNLKTSERGAKSFILQRLYTAMSIRGVEYDVDTPTDLAALERKGYTF